MKIVYTLAAVSLTIIVVSAWKYLNLSSDEWTTEELTKFASFMYTTLSGLSIVGAGFAFAYELNHRRAERAAVRTERDLRDLRVSMEQIDCDLEKLLAQTHSSAKYGERALEIFLHPLNALPEIEPIPEFNSDEIFEDVFKLELHVSIVQLTKLLNQLREICIAYDKASGTNIKSQLYRGRYYFPINRLKNRNYPIHPWIMEGWHEEA